MIIYKNSDFYSNNLKNNTTQWEFLVFIFLPYLMSIFSCILISLEVFFKKIHFAFFQNKYDIFNFYNKIIAASILLIYTLFKHKKKFFKNNEFFWICFVITRIQIPAIWNLVTITKIIELLNLTIIIWIIIYYVVYDYFFLNSLKRCFYDHGFFHENGKYILCDNKNISWAKVANAMLKIFMWFCICLILHVICITIKEQWSPTKNVVSNNQKAIISNFKVEPISLLFQVLIFAPIFEELIFRNILLKIGNFSYLSVILSGLLFGLIHVHGEDIFTLLTYSLTGGIIYCFVAKRYKNIWFSITLHFLWNLLATISLFR